MNEDFNKIQRDVDELRGRIEKPSKDFWDKLSSVSILISGVLVTLIGIFATTSYNNRQLESQKDQKSRELQVQRVQTVQGFFPYLTSEKESTKKGALISIAALGDEELATKLSINFGDEAGALALAALSRSPNKATAEEAVSGLATLSLSPNKEVAEISRDALSMVVSLYRNSIVTVSALTSEIQLNGIGIVVSEVGIVMTVRHLIREADQFRVKFSSTPQRIYSADKLAISTGNMGFLKISKVDEPLPFLEIEDTRLEEINQVIALLPHETASGRILRYNADFVITDIRSRPSFAGSPVISPKGKLVGFIISSTEQTTKLTNATVAKDLFKSFTKDQL